MWRFPDALWTMRSPILVHNILNVLNTRMGRPPGSQLKDMFKYIVRNPHNIMRRFHGATSKVNFKESTNTTFGVTPGYLLISYPMRIYLAS